MRSKVEKCGNRVLKSTDGNEREMESMADLKRNAKAQRKIKKAKPSARKRGLGQAT